VEEQRAGFGALGARLKAVEEQLIKTHGSLDSYLALFGNIEARLARLVDTASDPGALRDAVQSVLDRAYVHMGVEAFRRTCEVLDEVSGPLFGRHAAFDRLDRFLFEHDRGVLLITAPVGVGKSALLAAWSSYPARPNTIVARHFFSTKRPESSTRTSMVRSLAGQVSLKLGPDCWVAARPATATISPTVSRIACGAVTRAGSSSWC